MAQAILLRGAKQLLTLRGPKSARRGAALHELGIIEDGSVLIEDGIIVEVGSTRRLENLKRARTAIEVSVDGSIVMPAFIDPSLSLTLEHGNGHSGVPHKRKKLVDFYNESLALMRGCMQHGTLTAEVKAQGGNGHLRADVSLLQQLTRIGNQPIGMIRTWRIDDSVAAGEQARSEFRETLRAFTARKMVQFVEFSPTPEAGSDYLLLTLVDDVGIGVKLHWRGGSAEALADLLARWNPATISCPSKLDAAECALLAKMPGIVVFSPGREIIEERSDCVRELVSSGAAIALSSGYHPTQAPSFSMQMAIALATLRLGLSAEAAITAATINAAYAVGCGHVTGSLEVGKRADILVLSLPDYREIPRRFGINHVGIAIREGNIVLNRTRWKIGT